MYENQITLFKVVSKHPNAPMMNAEIDIDGVKYRAGLWQKTRKDGSPIQDRNGNRMYGGKIEPAEGRGTGDQRRADVDAHEATDAGAGVPDDDVPFAPDFPVC